nr:cysteine dioxygenase family protein [Paludisphaera mucosa]
MHIDREALGEAVHFDERGYQRTRIFQCEHFEALVLSWRSGQGSPIHDHGDSTCGLLVVQGNATETLFEKSRSGRLAPLRSVVVPEGAVGVSRGKDIHLVANLQPPGTDLVSLHVYSPPLLASRCYRLAETIFGDHDEILDQRSSMRMISL